MIVTICLVFKNYKEIFGLCKDEDLSARSVGLPHTSSLVTASGVNWYVLLTSTTAPERHSSSAAVPFHNLQEEVGLSAWENHLKKPKDESQSTESLWAESQKSKQV